MNNRYQSIPFMKGAVVGCVTPMSGTKSWGRSIRSAAEKGDLRTTEF
jgi:hypothetical protein